MSQDPDQLEAVRVAAPHGIDTVCSTSLSPGKWDALIVPPALYFSTPAIRKGKVCPEVLVHGPAHLFRSAWLAGVRDYLREPWTTDELFLRLRGPRPSTILWELCGAPCQLVGNTLKGPSELNLRLSASEASLLRLLVQRRGTPVSREVLAWEAQCTPGRVVDTLVGRLRSKLRVICEHQAATIVSVRGLGYRLP